MTFVDESTLKNRSRILSNGHQLVKTPRGPVIFWMNRDQRAENHWGLLYAQKQAEQRNTFFAVVFCLVEKYQTANESHYRFMLQGLKETALQLLNKGIPFYLMKGEPDEVIPHLCREWEVPLLVTDFNPIRLKREWEEKVIQQVSCPVHQVDSHNIVPCWEASSKQEYAAYTFRPRILKKLHQYLQPYPSLKTQPMSSGFDPDQTWMTSLLENYEENPYYPTSGSEAGENRLLDFLQNGLLRYDTKSNDPTADAVSGLSPYLHFGQMDPARCALSVMNNEIKTVATDSFLEQLIVRRELSDNFCFYQKQYDGWESYASWAKDTLTNHLQDRREYLYNENELDQCQTHDALWNAAQKEMRLTGYLHGYLRMYWAKKILEWSPSPQSAHSTAILLNDRYLLDGRDPNGYTGIAWSMGGVHDRAWQERPVYGKIRYMNRNGAGRKFDVDKYIEHVATLK